MQPLADSVETSSHLLKLATGMGETPCENLSLSRTSSPAVKFRTPLKTTSPSMNSAAVHTIDNDVLMSPDLAFKSKVNKKSKKKANFDKFASRVAVYDGNIDDLRTSDEPSSPVENRKVKIKSSPKYDPTTGDSADGHLKTGKLSFYRSLCTTAIAARTCLKKAAWTFCMKQLTTSFPYIYLGVLTAFVAEIFPGSPKYNVAILLVTLAATNNTILPEKSVRPLIVIFVIVVVSCAMDVITFIVVSNSSTTSLVMIALVAYSLVSKLLALYQFLQEGKQTERARKFIRRFSFMIVILIEL